MLGIREYIAIAAVAAVFGAGWTARGWKEGAEDAARIEAEQAAEARIERIVSEISEDTASQIAGIRVENKTIVQEVRREVFKEPVYTECRITADGLRLINNARAQSGQVAADHVPAGEDTGTN